MTDFVLPDKSWKKEEIDQFISEHNIADAKKGKNNFAKIGLINKWAEKNKTAVDSVTDEPNEEDEEDDSKKSEATVKMNDTYFDLDRSRTFIEFEVIAKSRDEAFEFIDAKEKAIVEKFNIKKPTGQIDMETQTHVLNDQVIRVTITIPTHYMQQIIREAIINA